MIKTFHIKKFDNNYHTFVVDGLIKLQNHEAALHDTRKIGDRKLCENYLEEILTNSHNGYGDLLIASLNDLPVGFVCFWLENTLCMNETEDSNLYGYISDIFVLDKYRKMGIARRMLDDVQDRLLTKNPLIKRLRICSLAVNSLAISAYEGAGFQPYEILYEKRLK